MDVGLSFLRAEPQPSVANYKRALIVCKPSRVSPARIFFQPVRIVAESSEQVLGKFLNLMPEF